jgi:hypothetical protein
MTRRGPASSTQPAAPHGITVLTVLFDASGDHDITLHSPDQGDEIRIGTRLDARIRGTTGRRYRAEYLSAPPNP